MWYEERRWRITASNFGDTVKVKKRRNKTLLCRSIFHDKQLSVNPMLHGGKYEKVALEKTEHLLCLSVG